MMRRVAVLVAATTVLVPTARAQGALSVQGYGYPTGQLSASALALGGSTAEIDPASMLNPAAIASVTRFSVYMQYEPEFRRTTAGGAKASSTTIRFPGFAVTGGYRRFVAGISASTLLDRSWSNTYPDSIQLSGAWVPSTVGASSVGAITDTRASVAYVISQKLMVGLALHGLVGENRLSFGRVFPDSTGLGSVTQVSTINYSGRAISLGVVAVPRKDLVVGASLRRGGRLEARQDDAALADADAPGRMGLSASYTGIPNTSLSLRFDHVDWSSMKDLGTPQMSVFDTDDIGAGMEVVGPRIGGALSFARLGLRSRTLPFGVNGEQVKEGALSGGFSLPVARGRGQIDLTLQRASRSVSGANEKAWMVGIGLGIRP